MLDLRTTGLEFVSINTKNLCVVCKQHNTLDLENRPWSLVCDIASNGLLYKLSSSLARSSAGAEILYQWEIPTWSVFKGTIEIIIRGLKSYEKNLRSL